jgi:hypothetical protein
MRKLAILGGVTTAAALAITGLTIRPADSASGRILRLYEHDTQQALLDLGDKGDSPGDRFVYSGDLFNRRGGKNIGRFAGECETVGTGPVHAESICSAYINLAAGKITGAGLFSSADIFGGKTVTFPITGGTGAYRNVRGVATASIPQDVPNYADASFVLYLN